MEKTAEEMDEVKEAIDEVEEEKDEVEEEVVETLKRGIEVDLVIRKITSVKGKKIHLMRRKRKLLVIRSLMALKIKGTIEMTEIANQRNLTQYSMGKLLREKERNWINMS